MYLGALKVPSSCYDFYLLAVVHKLCKFHGIEENLAEVNSLQYCFLIQLNVLPFSWKKPLPSQLLEKYQVTKCR